MGYTLRAGITDGRINTEQGTFEINDREVTVDDYETAQYLVRRYQVEWPGDDPGHPDQQSDDEEEDIDIEEQDVDIEELAVDAPEDYSRDELEEMSWNELRGLAAASDNPDVDGSSSKGDIVDALSGE